MENGNPQAQSVVTPPTAPEPTAAELQAKIADLEKQSEGRLRDLQSERAKRQEVEAKLNTPNTAPVSNDQDELGKVLNPYIAPVMERVKKAEAFVANTYRDKALEHLASKTGKSKEAVVSDKELDDKLTSIVKRYALNGNVYDVTVRACEIMELENLKEQEIERKRAATAHSSQSLPTGTHTPAVSSSQEYSEEDFNALPMAQYEKLVSTGTFHQNKDGKIVFTPTPK